jgi:N-acetylneuraminic acid mutarotase
MKYDQVSGGLAFLIFAYLLLPIPVLASEPKKDESQEIELQIQNFQKIPPLPDRAGFAGMYAGMVGDYWVAAGGANFPQGYPWEGGKKRWYDHVFVMDSKNPQGWQKLGLKLPVPMAYGISGTWNGRMICVGGESGPSLEESAEKNPEVLSKVFAIQALKGSFEISPLPSLPLPLKDSCGTVLGDHIFVFGGLKSNQSTIAQKELWLLDLNNTSKGWKQAIAFPGRGRIQAVCAVDSSSFYVFSGIEIEIDSKGLPTRKMPYLRDAWRYTPDAEMLNGLWQKLPDMPLERAAAPGPAWLVDHKLVLMGGAESALHRLTQMGHPGWSKAILYYDVLKEKWEISEKSVPGFLPKVTAPALGFGRSYIIFSGEVSPGRRSPEIFYTRGR